MNARLRVAFAGPYVSFQDAGRPGHLRYGVPHSGPMDRLSHAAANAVLGRTGRGSTGAATGIEVSRGGLVLDCVEGSVTIAVTGGDFTNAWNVRTLRAGDQLAVQAQSAGSWAYVSVLGRFDVATWLGHTATHARSGFGGGALHTGQDIIVANAAVDLTREGEIPRPPIAQDRQTTRVVMGPQDHHFVPEALSNFLGTTYTLTDAYDRMGVRLRGAVLPLKQALSIPSEPIVRGSVQVGGDHVPTVLLADHQTTGGYPKIATVISADLDHFAQKRSGDQVQFEAVSADQAIAIARDHHAAIAKYLTLVAGPARTLSHRLMHENLIGLGQPPDPS